MAYKTPTSRKAKRKEQGLNLIPILDAVFIFIFFLLMSTQFLQIFEIASDVPLVSNEPPPKSKKKPLALTLTIRKDKLVLSAGLPSRTIKTIGKSGEGYDLNELHDYLVGLKKKHQDENSIIFEPVVDLTYEEIVKIMDAVRKLNNTDEKFYIKDKDGIDVESKTLFDKIVFGNLMS